MVKRAISMKFGLTDETIKKINSVFYKHPQVQQVFIYGSRAKGDFKPGSDIDMVLKGVGLNTDVLLQIEAEIDNLNTPYLFDVSIYETLAAIEFKEHIDSVGQIFYER